MNENNFTDEKIKQMLEMAGTQIGISPEKLKENVDSEKLNRILSDPKAVEKMMSTPVAQALLKKFGKS